MTFLVQMLLHTPVYVYVLLAWLVWRGLLSLRLRTVALWRLFIVPSVFAATGLSIIWRANVGFPGVVAWLVSAVAFLPLGFVTGPHILRIDPSRHVTRAGSIVPLMRNLIIFGCQYGYRRRSLSASRRVSLRDNRSRGVRCLDWILRGLDNNGLEALPRVGEAICQERGSGRCS